MGTERTPPIGPGRGQPHDSKVSREEKQKIEKVREVDPDEETQRRKKFRSMMGDDAQPSEFEGVKRGRTPYEIQFHLNEGEKELNAIKNNAVPNPSYSAQPNVSETPEEDEEPSGDLPRSANFWEEADLPPDTPTPPKQYQETKRSIARSNEEADKKKAAPFGAKPDEAAPLGRSMKKEEKESPLKSNKKEKEESLSPFAKQDQAESFLQTRGKKEKDEKRDKREEKEPQLAPINFSPDIQAAVQTAATQAAPYISPHTVPLFAQMVGTMYFMIAPPGVSRTEIVLNNPLFEGSKFFGSIITIEKYSTAPNSFNVRLSGPDAAVAAFKANIPSLMTAFQNGKFNFRVHRLEAEYRTEKPVFHRKEKGKGKGSTGDFEGKKK